MEGSLVEMGIGSNVHYCFLDRQLNSFLWVAYMMQRSLHACYFLAYGRRKLKLYKSVNCIAFPFYHHGKFWWL